MFVKLGKLACVKSSKVLTSQNKARTKKRNFCKWWKHIFQPTVSDGKWHWLSPLMFTLGKRKKRERKWTVWQENTGVITNSIKKNKISQPLSNHYWFNYYSSKITLFVNDFFFKKKLLSIEKILWKQYPLEISHSKAWFLQPHNAPGLVNLWTSNSFSEYVPYSTNWS